MLFLSHFDLNLVCLGSIKAFSGPFRHMLRFQEKNQFATLCVEINSSKSWVKMKTLRDAYHSRHDIDAFSWLMGHWLDSPFFVCEMCAKRKIDTWFREKISAALLFETCSFEMSYDEAFRYQLSFNCL